LCTADSDFETLYGVEIYAAKVAVFILSNNKGPDFWGPRINKIKEDIFLELRRRKKPFVGFINDTPRVWRIRLYRMNNGVLRTKDIPIAKYEEKPSKGKNQKWKRGETKSFNFE
jgi:hypothetical protein